MPVVTTKKILADAVKNNYAIPHINISNLEHFNLFLNVAERLRSPIILAFTPGFISYYGIETFEGLCYAANKKYSIPFAIHLDHHKDPQDILNKINKNSLITSVMIDGSLEEYKKNIELTSLVVAFCKKRDISVEAELGVMKGQEENHNSNDQFYTNPEQANHFINETGIDSLAISIGTIHGCISKIVPNLDFSRLKELRALTKIPLVLHGASGISDEQIKEVVKLGINKINVATEFKVHFFNALKEYIQNNPNDSDSRNYFKAANNALAELIAKKIELFGSKNRAYE